MTESEQRALVEATERNIAQLLSQLEKATGCYVEGLAVHNVEVTTMASPAPEYLRRVAVYLRQQPRSQWQT